MSDLRKKERNKKKNTIFMKILEKVWLDVN